MFNNILETKEFPSSWGKSIICPIHKSGSTHMPENYRGISLTNTIYKIFTGIINKRLYEWAETNHKIDESQSGFRTGYSAIDNVFCLQAIVKKYLSKKGGRLYCIYIDFRKAFDKINHYVLFQSLQRKGIDGNCLHVLLNMYNSLYSCVKVQNTKTQPNRQTVFSQVNITEFFLNVILEPGKVIRQTRRFLHYLSINYLRCYVKNVVLAYS